jgi:hypothetical protein
MQIINNIFLARFQKRHMEVQVCFMPYEHLAKPRDIPFYRNHYALEYE